MASFQRVLFERVRIFASTVRTSVAGDVSFDIDGKPRQRSHPISEGHDPLLVDVAQRQIKQFGQRLVTPLSPPDRDEFADALRKAMEDHQIRLCDNKNQSGKEP